MILTQSIGEKFDAYEDDSNVVYYNMLSLTKTMWKLSNRVYFEIQMYNMSKTKNFHTKNFEFMLFYVITLFKSIY